MASLLLEERIDVGGDGKGDEEDEEADDEDPVEVGIAGLEIGWQAVAELYCWHCACLCLPVSVCVCVYIYTCAWCVNMSQCMGWV